jgi:hypothetical protein
VTFEIYTQVEPFARDGSMSCACEKALVVSSYRAILLFVFIKSFIVRRNPLHVYLIVVDKQMNWKQLLAACLGAQKEEGDYGLAPGIGCVDGRGTKELDVRAKSNIKEHGLSRFTQSEIIVDSIKEVPFEALQQRLEKVLRHV